MQRIFVAAFVLSAAVAFGEKMPFERYQGVIDRYPFGRPPPNFNPNQMASEVSRSGANGSGEELTPEQEALTKAISFSVINLEPDGQLMVGFTDLSVPNSPKHYYMRVGETRNGWIVKEADQGEKTMTVEKDGIEVSLSLGTSSKDAAVAAAGAKTTGAAAAKTATLAKTKSPLVAGEPDENGASMSFRARKARREAERAEAAARIRAIEEQREQEKAEQREREEQLRQEREAEREEQREQLLAIREELKRAREESESSHAEDANGGEE
ncbi:MAG: hypothetical protein J6W80_00120 [Kiritimatiellae bacterium]|nr:hypothetical protein [Kiritimatiellia bacterium]